VLCGHQIATRVRVLWGTASMVQAEVELLKAALRDGCNHAFLLLSDTCAPLYSLQCAHTFLVRTGRSFVSARHSHERREQYHCLPDAVRARWRKGSQWFVLTRVHARLVVSNWSSWCASYLRGPHS